MATTDHRRRRSMLGARLRSRAAARLSRLPNGRTAPGPLAAEIGARQDHHLGIHRRPGAGAAGDRHRRGFDRKGQTNAKDPGGAPKGICLPAHDRASTRTMSSCKAGTSSGSSAPSYSPLPGPPSPCACFYYRDRLQPFAAAAFMSFVTHRCLCLGHLAGLARLRRGADAALSRSCRLRRARALTYPRLGPH